MAGYSAVLWKSNSYKLKKIWISFNFNFVFIVYTYHKLINVTLLGSVRLEISYKGVWTIHWILHYVPISRSLQLHTLEILVLWNTLNSFFLKESLIPYYQLTYVLN